MVAEVKEENAGGLGGLNWAVKWSFVAAKVLKKKHKIFELS